MAYSNDRGRSYTKHSGNPIAPHIVGGNRDPKVAWYAPGKQWIMVLFLAGNQFRFLNSPDLEHWTTLHDIVVPNCNECPDFFEMAVDAGTRVPMGTRHRCSEGYAYWPFTSTVIV